MLFAAATRIFEKAYYGDSSGWVEYQKTMEKPGFDYEVGRYQFQNYSYYWNCIWLCAVTMTGVGYGDFFPQTHMGRVIISLASIFGLGSLALFVIAVSNFSKHDKPELKVLFKLISSHST